MTLHCPALDSTAQHCTAGRVQNMMLRYCVPTKGLWECGQTIGVEIQPNQWKQAKILGQRGDLIVGEVQHFEMTQRGQGARHSGQTIVIRHQLNQHFHVAQCFGQHRQLISAYVQGFTSAA
jgi:hypothetical protein